MSFFSEHSQAESIDTGSDMDADLEVVELVAQDGAGDEETKASKSWLEGKKWKLVNKNHAFLADLSLESSGSHANANDHASASDPSSPKDFLHDRQLLLNQQLRAAKGSQLQALLEKGLEREDAKEAAEAELRRTEQKHAAELAAKEEEIQDLRCAFEELRKEVKERFAFLEPCLLAKEATDAKLRHAEETHAAELASKEKEIQDLRDALYELISQVQERFVFLDGRQMDTEGAETDVKGRLQALEHYHKEAATIGDSVEQRLSDLEHYRRQAMVADDEVKERLTILEDCEASTTPVVNEMKERLVALEDCLMKTTAAGNAMKERLTTLEVRHNQAMVAADAVKHRLMAIELSQSEAVVACGEMRERLVAMEARQDGKKDDETECTEAPTLGDKPLTTSTNQAEFDLFEHIISQGKVQHCFVTTVAAYQTNSVDHLIRSSFIKFLGSEVGSLADAIPRILLEFQPQSGRSLPERPPSWPRLPGVEVDSNNKRVETRRFKNRNSGEEFNVRLFLNAEDRVEIMEIRIAKKSFPSEESK